MTISPSLQIATDYFCSIFKLFSINMPRFYPSVKNPLKIYSATGFELRMKVMFLNIPRVSYYPVSRYSRFRSFLKKKFFIEDQWNFMNNNKLAIMFLIVIHYVETEGYRLFSAIELKNCVYSIKLQLYAYIGNNCLSPESVTWYGMHTFWHDYSVALFIKVSGTFVAFSPITICAVSVWLTA